jgi:hypothetical protein
MLCGLPRTEVALPFCDEKKGVIEFILPLCLLIVSTFRSIYHGGKTYELRVYRENNTIITMNRL